MTGQNEFLELFGHFTVADVVLLGAAAAFVIAVYMKLKKLVIQKHDENVAKDQRIEEAHDVAEKYPEYRKQSIEVQKELKAEIAQIKETLNGVIERLDIMENKTRQREQNKLRDKLIQYYNYYTDEKTNPSHCWTEMEADAFWRLFADYEETGGDGFIHGVVEPAMRSLTTVKVSEKIERNIPMIQRGAKI